MLFHKLEEDLLKNPHEVYGFIQNSDERLRMRDAALVRLRNSQKFYAGTLETAAIPNAVHKGMINIPYPITAVQFADQDITFIVISFEIERGIESIVFSCNPQFGFLYLGRGRQREEQLQGEMETYGLGSGASANASLQGILKDTVFPFFICFLQVLNCVNVKTLEMPAPKFTNRQRALKGKPPIYAYKVLVLRPSAARKETLGGTHASPAIHLRRGHIKHRKTGDFWWQPCVVGDRSRGVVVKDYRADKITSPPASNVTPAV